MKESHHKEIEYMGTVYSVYLRWYDDDTNDVEVISSDEDDIISQDVQDYMEQLMDEYR